MSAKGGWEAGTTFFLLAVAFLGDDMSMLIAGERWAATRWREDAERA